MPFQLAEINMNVKVKGMFGWDKKFEILFKYCFSNIKFYLDFIKLFLILSQIF